MRTDRRTRIWLGMGTWVLTSAAALAAGGAAASDASVVQPAAPPLARLAQAKAGQGGETGAHHHAPAGKATAQGGEGGEGGEAGALSGADADEAFVAQLLLIRGHLRVGKELYDAGRTDDALPHYLHPAEEIYEDLEPQLTARKATGFEKELKALADAVKTKRLKADVAKQQDVVVSRLETARRGAPTATRDKPGFAAGVAVLLLKVAAEEYEAAIENGLIANAVEYQDSRGFVAVGRELVRQHEKAMRAKDAPAYEAIIKAFGDLRVAHPTVVPPEKPRLSAGEFQAAASRVELHASRFR